MKTKIKFIEIWDKDNKIWTQTKLTLKDFDNLEKINLICGVITYLTLEDGKPIFIKEYEED